MKTYGSLKKIVQTVFVNQSSAPSSPASGSSALYFKTDGKLYRKDSGGTETEVASATTATPTASGVVTSYFSTIQSSTLSSSSATINIAQGDGYQTIYATSTSDQTINLPAASGETGRRLNIIKTASGGTVTIDANSTEKINNQLTQVLNSPYTSMDIESEGSGWFLNAAITSATTSLSVTPASGAFGTVSGGRYYYYRIGRWMYLKGQFTNGTIAGGTATVVLPSGYSMDTNILGTGNTVVGSFFSAIINNTEYYSDGGFGSMGFDGSATDTIYFIRGTGGAANSLRQIAGNNTTYFRTSGIVDFSVSIPISQWADN